MLDWTWISERVSYQSKKKKTKMKMKPKIEAGRVDQRRARG